MGNKVYTNALWSNRTIGLLGGSFNPAHEGHRHISLYALKMLGLDAVWWMVSPQNPLKAKKDMAPLDARMESARNVARHPKIFVTDIERHLNTQYTLDTIKALQTHFPRTRFVWLMGGDNLTQFHKWHRWQEIFKALPVCVLDRPPRHACLKAGPAFERFRHYLLPQERAAVLKRKSAPAWTILHIPLDETSATAIRARRRSK
ncbi:MAG: nicotinate-nucleotide adenylyltransferase [Alphaproteobacteria bacterium]